MQHKLDSLCEQMNNIKDHSTTRSGDTSPTTNVELASNEDFGCDKIKFVDCGCWLCDQHRDLSHGLVVRVSSMQSNLFLLVDYFVILYNANYEITVFDSSAEILNFFASLDLVSE